MVGDEKQPRAKVLHRVDTRGKRCCGRLMSSEARKAAKERGSAMHDQCWMEPRYQVDDNVYCTQHASMIALKIMSGEIDHG